MMTVSSGTQRVPFVNHCYEEDICLYTSHALFLSVVHVNWTIAQPIQVTEGDGVIVRLSGEAFGFYANPIAIGVICAEVIATDVQPGIDTTTSTDTIGCCWYGLC